MNLLVASVISFSKEDLKAFGIFREHLKLILKVMDNEHTEEEIQEFKNQLKKDLNNEE